MRVILAPGITAKELNERRYAFAARGRELFPDWDRVAERAGRSVPLTDTQWLQFLMHPDGPRVAYHQMVRVCHGLEP